MSRSSPAPSSLPTALAAALVAKVASARRERARLAAQIDLPRQATALGAALAEERARVAALRDDLERRDRAAAAEADAIEARLEAAVAAHEGAIARARFERALAVAEELGLARPDSTALEREEQLPAIVAALAERRARAVTVLERVADAAAATRGPEPADEVTPAAVESAWAKVVSATRTRRDLRGNLGLRDSFAALAQSAARRAVRSALPALAADSAIERELGLLGADPLDDVTRADAGATPRR